MTRRTITIVLGTAVSLGIVVWMGYSLQLAQVYEAIRQANYWWLIPNIALIFFSMYQRAWRWRSMTAPIKEVQFSKLLSATAVGFMANNVLPLRLGEFVRAYSLSKQDKGISKSSSLAMIFSERLVFDLATLIAIFGIVLWTSDLEALAEKKSLSLLILTASVTGYVFALLMAKWPDKIAHFVYQSLSFFPERVREMSSEVIQRFALGLQFMRSPAVGLSVLGQTALIWFVLGISNYFVFQAFSLDVPLEASFVTLVVVSIAISAPSSPGFVGVYHYGVILSLGAYGVDSATAAGCAVIMHAAQYIIVTLYGLYHLKKGHLSLKEIEQEAEEPNPEVTDSVSPG